MRDRKDVVRSRFRITKYQHVPNGWPQVDERKRERERQQSGSIRWDLRRLGTARHKRRWGSAEERDCVALSRTPARYMRVNSNSQSVPPNAQNEWERGREGEREIDLRNGSCGISRFLFFPSHFVFSLPDFQSFSGKLTPPRSQLLFHRLLNFFALVWRRERERERAWGRVEFVLTCQPRLRRRPGSLCANSIIEWLLD